MTKRIFEAAGLAGLGVCSTHGNIAPRAYAEATKELGWRREFLYDFTLYRDWDDYALPEVIIEHENQWNEPAFLADFWKLMFGFAPLRVMIGYHRDGRLVCDYINSIRSIAKTRGWTYPNGVEDLVLLGHNEMKPRDFRVVHRASGASEWLEWKNLESFVKEEGHLVS